MFSLSLTSSSGVSGFLEELSDGNNSMTLGQIIQRLKETYCSSIGVVRCFIDLYAVFKVAVKVCLKLCLT